MLLLLLNYKLLFFLLITCVLNADEHIWTQGGAHTPV